MPAEVTPVSQLIEAAKDVRMTPLPDFNPSNQGDLEKAYSERLQFLKQIDQIADPETKLPKPAAEFIREEGLAQPVTRATLEFLSVISADPQTTGLGQKLTPDNRKIFAEVFPRLLADLQLGDELWQIVRDDIQLSIIPPDTQHPEALRDHYNQIANRLDALGNIRELSHQQRTEVARDVVALFTAISYPGRQYRPKQMAAAQIATEILIDYQLGPELRALLREETPVKTEMTTPAAEPKEGKSAVKPEAPAEKSTTTPPAVEAVSSLLATAQLDTDYIVQFMQGLGTPESPDFAVRVEPKAFADIGASHLEKFRNNFVQPVEHSLEKDLRTPETIAKLQMAQGRIELLLIQTISEPLQTQILALLKQPPDYHKPEIIKEALKRYAETVIDTTQTPRKSLAKDLIQTASASYSTGPVLKDTLNRLMEIYTEEGNTRNFGIAEFLIKQYRETQDLRLLRFMATMNELAGNPKTREKLGFDEIF